jgi:hypothetical protein
LEDRTATKDFMILQLLDTVKSRYVFWKYEEATGEWIFIGQEKGIDLPALSYRIVIPSPQRLLFEEETSPPWTVTSLIFIG